MASHYHVILEKEPVGGYHASCPTLKGCHSEGETEQETLNNAREAIEVYLESLAAHNEPIPQDLPIKSVPATQVARRIGFKFDRQKGSHVVYRHDEKRIVIPLHHEDLKSKTLHGLIKDMGLTPAEFASLL